MTVPRQRDGPQAETSINTALVFRNFLKAFGETVFLRLERLPERWSLLLHRPHRRR